MVSRRSQLWTYQFVADRVQRAALTGDPDAPDPGHRRLGRALFAGLMAGIIVFAGAAIAGLLGVRTDSEWQQRDRLVVVAETGARFVYLDRRLRAVDNLASARLALPGATDRTVVLPARALEGVPRGPRIGIAGAPDVLPERSALAGPPWTVCSSKTTTTLLLGPAPDGGTDATASAILVRAANGERFVLWQGRRHPATGTDPDLAVPVGDALLAATELRDPAELRGATPRPAPEGIQAVCVVWDPAAEPSVHTYAALPAALRGNAVAQRVVVEPGRGAIMQARGDAATDLRGRRYLLTDQGIRYELVSNGAVDAADALGYGGHRAVTVPGELVSLVPSGPALDPDALNL